ncbi:MAG: osmolarity sensor protein EnvZ [Pseudomonadota bacterium]
MRLLPRRIFPRLVLPLLLALGLSQAVWLCEAFQGQHRLKRGLVHSQVFEQIEATLRLLAAIPAERWDQTVEYLSLSDLCYAIGSGPAVADAAEADPLLADRLASLLRLYAAGPPRLAMLAAGSRPCAAYEAVSGSPHAGPADHSHDFGALAIAVPLADGRWLNAHARLVLPPVWERPTVISLLVLAGVTIGGVFLLVSHETRSLRRLAAAVERLGRGETVPRVPEEGPSEVVALIRAFNVMQDRLTRFIQDRTRLLGAISHDLRTPLTSLRLKAELLDDPELAGQMTATLAEMETIVRSSLDFARNDATSEPSREIDLTALVDSLVEDMAELGQEVAFADSPRLTLPARPTALRRALRNLIENAVRYGHRARVGCRRADGAALVEIADDGPGIPDDQVAEVVKPFVRLESSRNRATGGVGLGLAIAADIVAAHGGSLTLRNRAEGGLTATVSLPLPAAAGRSGASAAKM